MTNNVINFPNKDQLAGMRNSQKIAQNTAKGKKTTQQQALGALVETRQIVDGITNTLGRMSQVQITYEKILQQLDTNFGILMTVLLDKGVITEDDWKVAFDKHVVQPKEKALTDHIEKLKQGSAEDAFFAEVATMIRSHTWLERIEGEQKISPQQVQDYFLQMTLNPSTRRQILDSLRKEIPEIPILNIKEIETINVQPPLEESERKMPDCKYCGKPDCEFCNLIKESL